MRRMQKNCFKILKLKIRGFLPKIYEVAVTQGYKVPANLKIEDPQALHKVIKGEIAKFNIAMQRKTAVFIAALLPSSGRQQYCEANALCCPLASSLWTNAILPKPAGCPVSATDMSIYRHDQSRGYAPENKNPPHILENRLVLTMSRGEVGWGVISVQKMFGSGRATRRWPMYFPI